jgi:hypothetical protein
MAGIFISYRRIDSKAYAGRLFDRLSDQFGPDRVFMDVEGGIERGEDYTEVLERAVNSVDAMLVVIGRQWLACTDSSGRRRLDNADDWVRSETAIALRRNILIIPVLVDGALMPREDELPEDIKQLARKQASEVSDSRWTYDVGQIIRILESRLSRPWLTRLRRPLVWAPGLSAMLATAAIIAFQFWTPAPSPLDHGVRGAEPPLQHDSFGRIDLSGFWRDDDGAVFKVVPREGGDYEMGRIEPPESHPAYRIIRLDGREAEISIGVLPSGTQQAVANLQLSIDGNIMSGLIRSTQAEDLPVNWVLKRVKEQTPDKKSSRSGRSLDGIVAPM